MFPAIKRAQFWAQVAVEPVRVGANRRPWTCARALDAVAMHQGRPGRARGLCAGRAELR